MFIAPSVEMKTKTPAHEDSFLPGTVFLSVLKICCKGKCILEELKSLGLKSLKVYAAK
jgi:hypothetical protein